MTSLPPIEQSSATPEAVDPTIISTEPASPVIFPLWRLLVPLALQALLILAVPAEALYIYLTGKTAIIQTQPVDPYDFMRGYSQTLSYEISNPEKISQLPGWQELNQNDGNGRLFVILEAPSTNNQDAKVAGMPKPWQPVAVRGELPRDLPPNRVAIKGKLVSNWEIEYGLETYYMPEDQRDKINQEIQQLQANQRSFVVEVKVSDKGDAMAVSLWVGENNYRF
ncbi:MAG TPA: GDYXXLXY domain-containing protein [Oscillatoriaceae cyanobacterium M33_DOE_052]|uniref:Membrane-anchored protein n=1 Tax=Planktothricoides sp. SpSt-374 TaxID=2282167 RepID=A0A7C3ZWU1_9CYAN|nr:GDYXXLXY domain-containing protein [Oscillatoriaceae cyanobacterium M33_DOE_052]